MVSTDRPRNFARELRKSRPPGFTHLRRPPIAPAYLIIHSFTTSWERELLGHFSLSIAPDLARCSRAAGQEPSVLRMHHSIFAKAGRSTAPIPSRNALQALRQLALAGTTVCGLCAVGAITYDAHRRVRVAEKIIENKRALQSSNPYFDAKGSARRLGEMMEAAEEGRFDAWMAMNRRRKEETRAKSKAGDTFEKKVPSDAKARSDTPRKINIPSRSPFKFENPKLNLIHPRREIKVTTPVVDPADTEQIASGETKVPEVTHETTKEVKTNGTVQEPSDEAKMRELIGKGLEIEATNRFMDLTPRGHHMSDDRKELAYQLFAANCRRQNTFVARSLFERLEILMTIDVELWTMMMHLLAKGGHLDSVGRIYERHHRHLTVPVHLLEVVVRCLMESRRLNLGKMLLIARLRDDADCGLCGAYLDTLWRKTRNSEVINKEFRLIIKGLIQLGRKPTQKLFNPLIKAFIESGKFDDAKAVVRDMPEKWSVQPDCRSLGLLAYGHAILCDWTGVLAQLREMHSLGFTHDKKEFARAFDRVFLEFYPGHSSRQIWNFLMVGLNEFQLKPDKPLHRHIMLALIERGDAAMVEQITSMAKRQNWNSGLTENDIVKITANCRIAMQEAPVGLWRMLQVAKKQLGQFASSRQLMGSSADQYSVDRGVSPSIYQNAKATYADGVKKLTERWSLDVLIPLRKRMEQAIHAGRFLDVDEMLRNAKANGHLIKPVHLQLAMIAEILFDARPGLKKARELLNPKGGELGGNWTKISDTIRYSAPNVPFVPVFFQQIMQVDAETVTPTVLYEMALFEFYNICAEDSSFSVKHHAAVALARNLIKKNQSVEAATVLQAVYLSKWRKSHGIEQVLLKLLLRAYAHMHRLRGVWWCILTVLAREEPISQDFVVEVRRTFDRLEKAPLKERFQSKAELDVGFLPVVKQAADVLVKKAAGDTYWSKFKADPDCKRNMRSRPVGEDCTDELLRKTRMSVEKMITYFDEEVEFSLLTGHQQHPVNYSEMRLMWDEALMAQSTSPEEDESPAESVEASV